MSGKKQPTQNNVELAREHLMRSKVYTFVALLFTVGAIAIILYYYMILAGGEPMHVVQNPMIIAILLLPFVPAWFLAMLSKKRRAKAAVILKAYKKAQEKSA